MAKEATTEQKLGIVALILKVLKLDDEGKIGKFFAKEVKKAETAIRDLKNNLTAVNNVYQSDVEKLNDRLEDAKEAVDAAYQAVTPDDVPNNEKAERFSDNYWYKVERAEDTVEGILQEIKDLAEAHEDEVKDIEEQIARYQARITKISQG